LQRKALSLDIPSSIHLRTASLFFRASSLRLIVLGNSLRIIAFSFPLRRWREEPRLFAFVDTIRGNEIA
jgi:hypothetical protein